MEEFDPGIFSLEHDLAKLIESGGDEEFIDTLAARCDRLELARQMEALDRQKAFDDRSRKKAITQTPDEFFVLSAAMDR